MENLAKQIPILLFSGGMDSIIVKYLLNISNTNCLFIDMGTNENKQEWQFIKENYRGCLYEKFPLKQFELNNNIIPFRNNILSFIAANYGNRIIFGFTNGDTTKDKDYVFKAQMEAMLNYFSIDENKVSIPGPFIIDMPFKHLTKTEMLSQYLDCGGDPQKIISAKSCYVGNSEVGCGLCRSCLRKWIACTLNGIQLKMQNTPTVSALNELLNTAILKDRKKEIKEIERCINHLQQ